MNGVFTPWGLMTWPDARGQSNVLFQADGHAGPLDEGAPMDRALMAPMRWLRVRCWFGTFIVAGDFQRSGPHQIPVRAPPGATIN